MQYMFQKIGEQKSAGWLGAALLVAGMSILLSGCARESAAVNPANSSPEAKQGVKPMETASTQPTTQETPVVILDTSKGPIEITLWADKAPGTVSNFLAYVDDSFFDGLIFHRVIDGFMIQGGGFDASMHQKKTGAPIKNEASQEAPNARGTIAMARTSDINSATAQFFINLVDNSFLNHRDNTAQGYGYCAFGKVTQGMDVVDAIGKVPTGKHGMYGDVPTEPIVIKTVRRK